ncbi:MAG: alpha/beta hydrolase [Planctomycetes bacterium]|nr:alpha/beta hydrolase [Planctomycetota bacterium]
MVADTVLGPVEYALEGSGPIVVILHGGIGGWDQGLAITQDLGLESQFTVLAPSRAGYLRTPLSTCRTPEQTADAIVALLDDLGIDKVAVIGLSGGGPTALALALRLKDRVQALVMLVAITCRHKQPARTTNDAIVRLMFSDSANLILDFVLWVFMVQMLRILPRYMVKRLFKATETFDKKGIRLRVEGVMRHREQWTWMAKLFKNSLPLSVRKVGLVNDLKQFAALPVYPVENITCPTLVVHGRHDGNVPFSHAEFVADNVPNAELFVAETCGHLIWMSDDALPAREKVTSFLRSTLSGAL